MNIDALAREQFRLDTNCSEEMEKNFRIMINKRRDLEGARVVEGMTSFFRAVMYRGDAYIMADESIYEWVRENYQLYKPEWFCKYENLRMLDRRLNEEGYEIADTHVYLLPDPKAGETEYEGDLSYREDWLYEEEIASWMKKYGDDNPFRHALAGSKTQPDRMALLLSYKDRPVAMSGVSEDGKNLWQIGIDVLPEFSGRGLATYLTDMMKRKVLSMGHLPFYGTSESHALSMDTGIRAGFLPSWCEVFVREIKDGD